MAYTTLAEVRAMDGMDDTDAYPDDLIEEAIEYAEELIDEYTGTSWTYKTFTTTLPASGTDSLALLDDQLRPIMFPRTITSVTVNGEVVDHTGWSLYPDGLILRDRGWFDHNVVVTGTAGITATPPRDIAWCARTIARQYLVDLSSRVPDRALQVQSEFGNIMLAQASAHPDRPTSLPEVNARLSRRRQRPPTIV